MSLFDLSLYEDHKPEQRLIKDMMVADQPLVRLSKVGPQAVSTAELLACILQTKDALDLSHRLLAAFGSLKAIARATLYELQNVNGIGPATAARIRAALEFGRRYQTELLEETPRISSPADAANLLIPQLMHLEQEHLVVVMLNTRNGLLGVETIYKGSLNTSVVRIAELFRPAIRNNAAAIIVAHNHPSGDPAPSPEDVNVTRQIVRVGKELDISVLDHLIIGHNRYKSLKESGLGFD